MYGRPRTRISMSGIGNHASSRPVVASNDTLVLDRDDYTIAPSALVVWALGT
jgi:hypothetical protein